MEKNDTINFVFLFLCVLLLGFVYLNNKMLDETQPRTNATGSNTVVENQR